MLNNIDSGRFLDIERNITFAWQIISKSKPRGTSSDGLNPNNAPMIASDLQNLKTQITQMAFGDLDNLFDHKPYPNSIIV